MTNIKETIRLIKKKIAVKDIHNVLRNIKIKSIISYLLLGKSFIYISYRIRYLNVDLKLLKYLINV